LHEPIAEEASIAGASRKIASDPPVFFVSAGLILAFALFGALAPERAGRLFAAVQALIVADFGWFYIAAVAGFLVFVLFLMFSRYGWHEAGSGRQ
jgi:choline/glycine/proline betaine transport protein